MSGTDFGGTSTAHQELHQLASRDSDVANAVISNPYTRVCCRLSDFEITPFQKIDRQCLLTYFPFPVPLPGHPTSAVSPGRETHCPDLRASPGATGAARSD